MFGLDWPVTGESRAASRHNAVAPRSRWRAVPYIRAAASGEHLPSTACEEWGQGARGRYGVRDIRSNPGALSLLFSQSVPLVALARHDPVLMGRNTPTRGRFLLMVGGVARRSFPPVRNPPSQPPHPELTRAILPPCHQ